jgi:hypothetical protein
VTHSNNNLTGVYIIGVLSCLYHGVGLWVGLFWPWYIGAVFLKAGF